MKVYVQFSNRSFGCASSTELEDMINGGYIVSFKRSDGWVDVTNGPIRNKYNQREYFGPERRMPSVSKSCLTCFDFVDSRCIAASYCRRQISLQAKTL